jgi:hypothetical protein
MILLLFVGGFHCWGHSSAGRAPALQAGGHRFDPDCLHHRRLLRKRRGCRLAVVKTGMLSHGDNRLSSNDESLSQLLGPIGRDSDGCATLGLYRGMFEFGVNMRLGNASRVYIYAVLSAAYIAVELFFVSVNQVLLRLWTRVMDVCPWGNS